MSSEHSGDAYHFFAQFKTPEDAAEARDIFEQTVRKLGGCMLGHTREVSEVDVKSGHPSLTASELIASANAYDSDKIEALRQKGPLKPETLETLDRPYIETLYGAIKEHPKQLRAVRILHRGMTTQFPEVKTLKDFFHIGEAGIASIMGIGPKGRVDIQTILKDVCPDIPFTLLPTAYDTARYCRSIAEIPAIEWQGFYSDPLPTCRPLGMNILECLRSRPEDLATKLDIELGHGEKIIDYYFEYARTFKAARTAILGQ